MATKSTGQKNPPRPPRQQSDRGYIKQQSGGGDIKIREPKGKGIGKLKVA
jgi:hypothetical protein